MNDLKNKLVLRIINVVAPRVVIPKSGQSGIVLYTTHGHADRLIFSVKSFYFQLGFTLPAVVIDDGRMTRSDVDKIKFHIPGIRVLRKRNNDILIKKYLGKYAYCNRYRFEDLIYRFNIKLFDPFLLSGFAKTIYIDDDIIFLSKPEAILDWLNSNRKYTLYATESEENGGLSVEWLTVEKMFAKIAKSVLPFRFNSGFICINKQDYNLQKIDRSLKFIYSFALQKTWTPEQYSLGILCGESKHVDLKQKYIHLTRNTETFLKQPFAKVFLHFAFEAKPLYYKYARILALRTLFFRARTA